VARVHYPKVNNGSQQEKKIWKTQWTPFSEGLQKNICTEMKTLGQPYYMPTAKGRGRRGAGICHFYWSKDTPGERTAVNGRLVQRSDKKEIGIRGRKGGAGLRDEAMEIRDNERDLKPEPKEKKLSMKRKKNFSVTRQKEVTRRWKRASEDDD